MLLGQTCHILAGKATVNDLEILEKSGYRICDSIVPALQYCSDLLSMKHDI